MNARTIEIEMPFAWCKYCRAIDLETDRAFSWDIYTDEHDPVLSVHKCSNQHICYHMIDAQKEWENKRIIYKIAEKDKEVTEEAINARKETFAEKI